MFDKSSTAKRHCSTWLGVQPTESSGNKIGTEAAPLLPKHRGTPLVDLLRRASFVGEISPLEDLAIHLAWETRLDSFQRVLDQV
jgi:hypothetical protein